MQQTRNPTGLYRSEFEKDNCGFGLIAQMDNQPSHWLVQTSVNALARLTHADGQPAAAEALLHRVLARQHDAEAWALLGDWRAAQGDDATARRCYANALRAQRGEPAEPLPGRGLRDRIAAAAALEERDEHGMPRLPGSR